MIEGVKIKELKKIEDERGYLMEMLRCDDPIFEKFGQVYLSVCKPGYVKAWHYHKIQTDNFVVVFGIGKVVLYDMRKESKTYDKVVIFVMGEHNESILLTIPPYVLHGIECIGDKPCCLANIPSEVYDYDDPDEHRIPFDSKKIPYKWAAKKGGR